MEYEILDDTPLADSFLRCVPKTRMMVDGVPPMFIRLLVAPFENWVVSVENMRYNEIEENGEELAELKFDVIPFLVPKQISQEYIETEGNNLENRVKGVILHMIEQANS